MVRNEVGVMNWKDYFEYIFCKPYRKRTYTVVILLFIISSFLNFAMEEIFGVSLNLVFDYFSIKPEVTIYVSRIEQINTIEQVIEKYPRILRAMIGCGEKELNIFTRIDSSENTTDDNIMMFFVPGSRCEFEDGDTCYFHIIQIKNTGSIPVSKLTIDGNILSRRVKFLEHSPKIEKTEGTGLFEEGGFHFKIDKLNVNETIAALIKADSISEVILTDEINGKERYSDYRVYHIQKLLIEEDDVINYEGEILELPMIDNFYTEGKLFDFDFVNRKWTLGDAVVTCKE